jgi:hypothetical protein
MQSSAIFEQHRISADEGTRMIKEIVTAARAAQEGEGQLKAKLDEVKKIALACGMGYYLQLPPYMVGIHPDNRNGLGASGQYLLDVAVKIVDGGFSLEEAVSTAVFEDLKDKRGAKFTVQLQSRSSYLPNQVEAQITYVACSGTHTYQFFNAVNQGSPVPELDKYKSLADRGFMSKAKILRKCPQMAETLEKGLNCFIFRRELWEDVPKLPWLVQAGANKPNAARTKPTQFQALQGMQCDVSESMTAKKTIDKKEIMRLAAQDSEHVDEFPGMLDWICVYGGGKGGFWTRELCHYVAECCPANTRVKGEVFMAISGWKRSVDAPCPVSSVALLKLAAKRPLLNIKGSDAKKIGDLELLPTIEQVLQQGRTVCQEVHGGYNSLGSKQGPLSLSLYRAIKGYRMARAI